MITLDAIIHHLSTAIIKFAYPLIASITPATISFTDGTHNFSRFLLNGTVVFLPATRMAGASSE
jgi:hypothetical protein